MAKLPNNSSAVRDLNPIVLYARDLRGTALVLDTETTGLNDNDEVVELSIVKAVNGTVLIDERYRPTKAIDPGASKVTGIYDSDVADKSPIAEAWSRIQPILNGAIVCGWNVEFDRKILAQTCYRYELEAPKCEWVCLMQLYQEFKNIQHRCKLEYACEAMKVKPGDHSAVADALAAARVLYKIAETPAEALIAVGKVELQRDTDDLTLMTASEYLTQNGWREKRTQRNGKVVSLFIDPFTGAERELTKAIEIQRERKTKI